MGLIGKLKKNGLQLKYFILILVNPKDLSIGIIGLRNQMNVHAHLRRMLY